MDNLRLIKSICCLTNDKNIVSKKSLMLKDLIMHKKFSNKALLEQERTHVTGEKASPRELLTVL